MNTILYQMPVEPTLRYWDAGDIHSDKIAYVKFIREARWVAPLAITLFALFAARPLFVNQLTCSDDSAFHIGRAVNLEALIDSGHFFPRWSPYMVHGYGYPFFNYYAPLTSYLLVALHKLGLIYTAAFHVALFLCLWTAGIATYAFARDWWGEAGGLASAVVYLTAPYFAYDTLFRGNLAESFALALPPLILFTVHRALKAQRTARLWIFDIGLWSLGASLSFAALMLTHNASALMVTPLVAAYIALLAYLQRTFRALIHGGLILALGLALSAYFWLPALTETNLVQTDKLLVPPIFTYYTNYLTPGELLATPSVIDPLLINPSPAKAVGVVATLLALLGLGAVIWIWQRNRTKSGSPATESFWFALWLLLATLVYAFLTLSASRPIWDSLPLINFIQFPWRMLAPATLCAALLAGAAVQWLPKRAWLISSAICLVAALGNLSWWYPRYCAPFKDSTVADTLQYELATFTLGTTAKGEYLPRTVKVVPVDLSLANALIDGQEPTYLTSLAANFSVTVTNADPLNYEAQVSTAAPAELTFNQFSFPGWVVKIDGQPALISPAPETGLITVEFPEGEHQVSVEFTNTPLRTTAITISLLALVIALGLAIWVTAKRLPISTSPRIETENSLALSNLVLAVPLTLLLLRPLVIDKINNPLQHSAFDGQAMTTGETINANLASGLTILSTQFPRSVQSGAEFETLLYMTAHRPMTNEYRPRFDLVDSAGLVWNNGNDALPPRWHREPPETTQWPAGQYAQWARTERVLPGTPPGDYQLNVTVFDRATLAPDSVVDENGNPTAPVTLLRTIHITRPIATPSESDLNIQYKADFDFGPMTLLGYNLDRTEARPGESVLITLFLRADERMPNDLTFNLLTPSYPTSQWQVGDIWRFQVFQRIPAEADGPFKFSLKLNGSESAALDLTSINVTAPERVFTAPAIANTSSILFGDSIELNGYSIEITDNQLRITLLWHALATPSADLSAFIHIEDSTGRIVAQSDAIPANWSRPTPGWVAGEYILDPRLLAALPAGEYTVYVGLADRLTGARLLTANGQDRAQLGIYKAP